MSLYTGRGKKLVAMCLDTSPYIKTFNPILFTDGDMWPPLMEFEYRTNFTSIDDKAISLLRESMLNNPLENKKNILSSMPEDNDEEDDLLTNILTHENGLPPSYDDVQLLKDLLTLADSVSSDFPGSTNYDANKNNLTSDNPVSTDPDGNMDNVEIRDNSENEFSLEQSVSSESSNGEIVQANFKGKKRKADPKKWFANKAKNLRNAGKPYISKYNKKNMSARKVRAACTICKYNCSIKFSENDRLEIFKSYWKLEDVTRKREYLIRHMEEIKPDFRYPKSNARNLNCAYYFERGESKIRVCKNFFMSTLDINSKVIATSRRKIQGGFLEGDLRGKHGHHKCVEESIKERMRAHILSIPRVESHYLRQQTTRQYIEGGKTIASIFRDYQSKCKENGEPCGNVTMFTHIFNTEFNISFFVPKKDQCDVCVAYENCDKSDETVKEEYLRHQTDKKFSRLEKKKDKEETPDHIIVCSYDLQAALPTPKGDVSVFYYKSKLSTYNLTIYELKTMQGICNVWHEGEANRGAIEIASSVYKYLEEKARLETEMDFVFYTDNCGGQNKNKFILVMYMYAVHNLKNIKSITHKFMIKGHTQNEGDSVHSVIEQEIRRTLRSRPIYVPSQYSQLIRTSKKNQPYYKVNEFYHLDFLDFKDLTAKLGGNFNMNTEGETFNFTDVKVVKVNQENPFNFLYKTSLLEDFKTVDIYQEKPARNRTRASKAENITLEEKISILDSWTKKAAYSAPTGISENKKRDLMSLVNSNHVPHAHYDFYDNLRVKK